MVALGLCCCAGLSRVSASGLLSCDASLALEPRLQGARASAVAAPGLGDCGTPASLLPGVRDLPGLSLCVLHWQAGSLLLSHQGSPLMLNLILGQLGTSGLGYIRIF